MLGWENWLKPAWSRGSDREQQGGRGALSQSWNPVNVGSGMLMHDIVEHVIPVCVVLQLGCQRGGT